MLVRRVVLQNMVVEKIQGKSIQPYFQKYWICPRLNFEGGFPLKGGDLVEVDPNVGYVDAPIVQEDLLLGRVKMILENKRSVLQNSGSQKLSQIGKSRLFKGRFQYSNFRNKFVIVFYSCVRVVSIIRDLEIIQKYELVNMWGSKDLSERLVNYFETGRNSDPFKEKVFGIVV
ncbi:hypothetical protein [Leptospira weilii]|uniref:hypothetical protein n=1 Tax=Leptospira weilii TaxID=28184 RepID=UPI0030B92EB6